MTSSIASIVSCYDENGERRDLYNESHWSDPDFPTIGKYEKSKLLAERAAWDFIEKQSPDGHRVELTAVCPGFMVGPTLVKSEHSSSRVAKMFLEDKFPGGIPRISFTTVDVRDVAQAHVNCIERDEAQGKRYILSCESLWMT